MVHPTRFFSSLHPTHPHLSYKHLTTLESHCLYLLSPHPRWETKIPTWIQPYPSLSPPLRPPLPRKVGLKIFGLSCCRKPHIFQFKVNPQGRWAVKILTREVGKLWAEPGRVRIKMMRPLYTSEVRVSGSAPSSPRWVRDLLSPFPKAASVCALVGVSASGCWVKAPYQVGTPPGTSGGWDPSEPMLRSALPADLGNKRAQRALGATLLHGHHEGPSVSSLPEPTAPATGTRAGRTRSPAARLSAASGGSTAPRDAGRSSGGTERPAPRTRRGPRTAAATGAPTHLLARRDGEAKTKGSQRDVAGVTRLLGGLAEPQLGPLDTKAGKSGVGRWLKITRARVTR